MTCDERQDSLLEYALGTLDGPELESLRAHLQGGCPVCAGRLAEARAMLGLLPLTLPAENAPPSARRRLMHRLRVNEITPMTIAPTSKTVGTKRSPVAWWVPVLIGAAAAACVVILLVLNNFSTVHQQVAVANDLAAKKTAEMKQMDAAMDADRQVLKLMQSPTAKVMDLKPMPAQPVGNAKVIWDADSGMLCLSVANVQQLAPGKGYELWVFDKSPKPMPAGTLMVDKSGTARMTMKIPTDPHQVIQVAITDEPYNQGQGMPSPTGNIQFLQKLQ